MKLFHLSDLHIGLKLYNRDLREDQAFVFHQICDLARQEQPDAVLIAGDLYDRAVPSAEAVELFDAFVTELSDAVPRAEIMMISGNHDNATRINVYRGLLSRQHLHMIGLPPQRPEDSVEKITLHDAFGPVDFYLLPFVKPSMVRLIVGTDENGCSRSYDESVRLLLEREQIDPARRNVLVSHQFYLPVGTDGSEVERMDNEVRTVGNIDSIRSDVLEPFDYAALGHIHKPMKVGCDRWRYCGTPIPCSVSEAGQQKGIIRVELGEKGHVETTVLPLHPLHQIRKLRGPLEQILEQASDDYVVVVLTDQQDLDVLDMQDRLRAAFPNLLEIQRELNRSAGISMEALEQLDLDPFSLCSAFLPDLEPAEQEILQDIINTVQEAEK